MKMSRELELKFKVDDIESFYEKLSGKKLY